MCRKRSPRASRCVRCPSSFDHHRDVVHVQCTIGLCDVVAIRSAEGAAARRRRQEFRNCLVEQPKLVEAVGLFFQERPRGARGGGGGGGGGPLGPPVQDCPRECGGGRLYLKTLATSGNFVISCSNWPNCNKSIWLPACTKEAVVLDTPQSRCANPACGPGAPPSAVRPPPSPMVATDQRTRDHAQLGCGA